MHSAQLCSLLAWFIFGSGGSGVPHFFYRKKKGGAYEDIEEFMRRNEEFMRNFKINDNSGHLDPYSARNPLGPI